MAKISLLNRKRITDLDPSNSSIKEKRDELLQIKFNQTNNRCNFINIAITKLLPDKKFNLITTNHDVLISNIKKNGLIQPLIVTGKNKNGFYIIINGQRRFEASKKAGLSYIPCILKQGLNSSDILLLKLLENEPYSKFSPFDEGLILVELLNSYKSKIDLSNLLGCSKSWISMRLKVIQASSSIRKLFLDRYIHDVRTLYELTKLEQDHPKLLTKFVKKVFNKEVCSNFRNTIKKMKQENSNQLLLNRSFIDINRVVLRDNLFDFITSDKKIYRFRLSKSVLNFLKLVQK